MTSPSPTRPRLYVSDVVAARPDDLSFQHLIDLLRDRLVEVTARDWEVVVAPAQDDGPEAVLAAARTCDAVAILGGEDVAPEFYEGASPYPHESVHQRIADQAQIALVRDCLQRRTPLLGICRGMQVLDVALGGNLVQDLTRAGHRSDTLLEDLTFARHDLVIDPDSALASALVPTSVHSAHHQAVDRLGEGLRVAATAPDGTVEAIEHEEAPLWGVQWHPEDPAADAQPLLVLLSHLRPRPDRERVETRHPFLSDAPLGDTTTKEIP